MPFAEATDGCRLHYEVSRPGRPASAAHRLSVDRRDGVHVGRDDRRGRDGGHDDGGQSSARGGFRRDLQGSCTWTTPEACLPRRGRWTATCERTRSRRTMSRSRTRQGVDRFVALGYSWSGNAALQVASRTDRCAGVAIGGWPPLSGPYAEILGQLQTMIAELEPDDPVRTFQQMIANYYDSIVGHWDEEAAVAAP